MAKKTDQENDIAKLPAPVEWTSISQHVAEQAQSLISDFLRRNPAFEGVGMSDALNIGKAFADFAHFSMYNPTRIIEAQISLWQEYLLLWQNASQRFLTGSPITSTVINAKEDRRFKDSAWTDSIVFNFIKQSYLITARWLMANVRNVAGVDEKNAQKVAFYTQQFVDALAPSNFVLTNPEVLRATIESGGENLLHGLKNLLSDLEASKGQFTVRMTDPEAFTVGKNVAVTPGKVVAETALMQLLQYAPTTTTVAKRPLLIVPPWINKYYVLDLRQENSFVKWVVGKGHTVFVISWVNPDESLSDKNFEDYMVEGLFAALDHIKRLTNEAKINVLGYCLGGTLLAMTLAVMNKKKDKSIASATYLATLVDYKEAGDLSVFIDEEQISALEQRMNQKGYLEGSTMAATFNMLRSNDLIWSFVINNYLLGKEPFPFDLLYWNSDTTRIPAAAHSYYLRNMYLHNRLKEPDALTLCNVPINIKDIKVPSFVVACHDDHIAPWRSVYSLTQLMKGKIQFLLSASGHIVGVVNPPESKKYGYWTSADPNNQLPSQPEAWFQSAVQHRGSWWPTWESWISDNSDGNVPARKLDPSLPDAPGSYVFVKS